MSRRLIILVLALWAPSAALAQHRHAHDHQPKHGGLVKETGGYVYELKASPSEISVWVTDEADKPVETRGSTAKVTLVPDAKTRVEVPLTPAGGNRHAASGAFPVGPGTSALLEVAVGGKPIARLRYVLK